MSVGRQRRFHFRHSITHLRALHRERMGLHMVVPMQLLLHVLLDLSKALEHPARRSGE